MAESLVRPQKDVTLDSAVTQANTRLSYDVFISYSHQNKTHADKLLETLSSVDPDLKIFIDTAGLNTGTSWQQLLYNALGKMQWSSCQGTGHNKFVWRLGGVIKDTT